MYLPNSIVIFITKRPYFIKFINNPNKNTYIILVINNYARIVVIKNKFKLLNFLFILNKNFYLNQLKNKGEPDYYFKYKTIVKY